MTLSLSQQPQRPASNATRSSHTPRLAASPLLAASLILLSTPSFADPDISALFQEYKERATAAAPAASADAGAAGATSNTINTGLVYGSMLGTSPLTQSTNADTSNLSLEEYFNLLKAKAIANASGATAAPAPQSSASGSEPSTVSTLLTPSDKNTMQSVSLLPELLDKLDHSITDNGLAYGPVRSMFPGRIMDSKEAMDAMLKEQKDGAPTEVNFYYPWLYRDQTYEMHFAHPQDLASCIYSLAIFTKDISPNVPYEKFIKGVSGFHYSVEQICDWINALQNSDQLRENELAFIALLRHDGVIERDATTQQYKPKGKVAHVLAASASKKRSILTNLRHERLHVYWDLDSSFRDKYIKIATSMSPEEQKQAFKHLVNYNQENIAQLIEEWAIGQAEKEPLKQKSEL